MEIMGKVGLMNLTVCPVGETTTQRGAVMSSFETQQVTLRTKSKSKPKINILNFSVIMLLKVELVSIILLRLLWCAVWDKVKGALKPIIASQPRGIVSSVPSNTKSTLHVFKCLSRDSITVRATARAAVIAQVYTRDCSWGSQGKTEVVCHSLLQWTTFCQNSPP